MADLKKNCICQKLESGEIKFFDIADFETGPYISLIMKHGCIEACGEDNASCSISYCPFCGRKLKL